MPSTMKRSSWVLAASLVVLSACGSGESKDVAGMEDSIRAPSRPQKLLKATEVFGPLSVAPGHFSAAAKKEPWPGWWFPLKEDKQFVPWDRGRGWKEPSPLERYDQYVKRVKNRDSSAVQAEASDPMIGYNPDANANEGRCNAWAVAAIVEDEPTSYLKAGGVEFSIFDQKALLVKAYENVEVEFFGQKNESTRDNRFEDIFPDQFHRFLQAELFQNRRAFVMDYLADIYTWNVPVYKADLTIRKDETNRHVVHVEATLTSKVPYIPAWDYTLATFDDKLSRSFYYTYDLFGNYDSNGTFHVLYGEWTGDSAEFHPDFVVRIPENPRHSSYNPQVDPKIIAEIMGHR